MKRIIFSLCSTLLFIAAKSQTTDDDTSLHTAAIAVCDCLGKANLPDKASQADIQQAFLTCVMSSAPQLITKMAESGDMQQGQEMAMKLGMEMMKTNCPAFTKIAGAMAMNGGGNMDGMQMNTQPEMKIAATTDGVVTKVEERDFTYITVKTTASRELNFIYYSYVPGSDDWIKDPNTKLKNKNVSLSYVESEVYQPKFKQFMNVKEIKTLTIK